MNLVDAALEGSDVVFGQFRVPLDWSRRPAPPASGRVVVGIRPEAFEDAAFAPSGLPTLDVEVVVLEELGSDAHVFFRVDATRIAAVSDEGEDEGAELVGEERGSLLNARVDPRTTARVGDSLRLAVDPARFHFFDADSGSSLLLSVPAELPEPASPVGR
jgi:multiple sugar transport system ATP-binding protein